MYQLQTLTFGFWDVDEGEDSGGETAGSEELESHVYPHIVGHDWVPLDDEERQNVAHRHRYHAANGHPYSWEKVPRTW